MYFMYIFRRGAMWFHKLANCKQLCVLSKTIYHITFATLQQFPSLHLISETCMNTASHNNNYLHHNRC